MKNTVKSQAEMDRLFKKGKRSSSRYVLVLSLPVSEETGRGRMAFVAGKKTGNAPVRNQSKRKLREAARTLGGPWTGYDVVFVARTGTAQVPQKELLKACSDALERLSITKGD